MNGALKKNYARLIYSKCFRYMAVALAVSALVGGAYGAHSHFIFALCAAGALLIGRGWLAYLRMTGYRPLAARRGNAKRRVPYFHQRVKDRRRARPAFRKDFRDFDDDLTYATAVDEAVFPEKDREAARLWANMASGGLVILLSFVL